MDVLNPVSITAAIFLAIFFTDLFKHNYKNLPVNALVGFACVLLVSVLYQNGFYITSWVLIASPFLILLGSILIRDHRIYLSNMKTLHPNEGSNLFYSPYFI
jgi:hypothetical protein